MINNIKDKIKLASITITPTHFISIADLFEAFYDRFLKIVNFYKIKNPNFPDAIPIKNFADIYEMLDDLREGLDIYLVFILFNKIFRL